MPGGGGTLRREPRRDGARGLPGEGAGAPEGGEPQSRFAWVSHLSAPGTGALGEMRLNGSSLWFTEAGSAAGAADLPEGENTVELRLVGTYRGPATWRFEMGGGRALVPGSLRALRGEAVAVGPDSIAFRWSGDAGESVAFAFRVRTDTTAMERKR
jgi:hypothetical protein